MYKNKEQKSVEAPSIPPPAKKVDYVRCSIHIEKKSAGLCSMCEGPFCEDCLKSHENLNFCSEHYRTFLENKWAELQTVKTNPDTPKEGIFLYQFKGELMKEGVPAYIVTQYKINVQDDYIESYVTLYARTQDEPLLKQRLNSASSALK